MSCPLCDRQMKNSNGESVRYCKCGVCNHCHVGGVLHYGNGHTKVVIKKHGPTPPQYAKELGLSMYRSPYKKSYVRYQF